MFRASESEQPDFQIFPVRNRKSYFHTIANHTCTPLADVQLPELPRELVGFGLRTRMHGPRMWSY